MSTLQIILNTNNRRNAAKALGLVPGSDEFKSFTGPTFKDIGQGWYFAIENGCVHVWDTGMETEYYYPLHTVSRVKVSA